MIKPVHLWEIDGFVKLSDKAKNKIRSLVKDYGMRKLSRELKFYRGTVYRIYTEKDSINSIYHLVEIAKKARYNLWDLEKEVVSYGRIQTNMYNLSFPFILNPLQIRAIAIHGDGSFNKRTHCAVWYQSHKWIEYMVKLLNLILKTGSVKSRHKDEKISYVTIPSVLTYLACKSLDLKLEKLSSLDFFKKVTQLPKEFQFQVFCQFILDEGHFKDTTLTIAQYKQETRKGLLMLLKNLDFEHSNPRNNKNDITIYIYSFPKIIRILDEAIARYGNIAGFWFKENEFRAIYKKCDVERSRLIVEGKKINKEIFCKLREEKRIFSCRDIIRFSRNPNQAKKAIRNWRKNRLIERINQDKYRIIVD